jgi:hypothetical protein
MSPCGKVHRNETGDIKEPEYGKGSYFKKKLDWLPLYYQGYENLLKDRWIFRFKSRIRYNEPMTYMPKIFGGMELPCPFPRGKLILDLFSHKHINTTYLRMVSAVLNPNTPLWVHRTFNLISKGGMIRGVSKTINEIARENYSILLRIFNLSLTEEQIRDKAGHGALPYKPGYRKLCSDARELGFLPDHEAFNLIERSWMLKEVLTDPAIIAKSGFRNRILSTRVLEATKEITLDDGLELPQMTQADILKLAEVLFTEEMPWIKGYFISDKATSRVFGGLMTPLPAEKEDREFVLGSSL